MAGGLPARTSAGSRERRRSPRMGEAVALGRLLRCDSTIQPLARQKRPDAAAATARPPPGAAGHDAAARRRRRHRRIITRRPRHRRHTHRPLALQHSPAPPLCRAPIALLGGEAGPCFYTKPHQDNNIIRQSQPLRGAKAFAATATFRHSAPQPVAAQPRCMVPAAAEGCTSRSPVGGGREAEDKMSEPGKPPKEVAREKGKTGQGK